MEMKDVMKLREAWDGSPCEHTHLIQERFKGIPTGEYVCTRCGKDFSFFLKGGHLHYRENEKLKK